MPASVALMAGLIAEGVDTRHAVDYLMNTGDKPPLLKEPTMINMIFAPYTTNHQHLVNMANSARNALALCDNVRTTELEEIHACRVHQLMGYRAHTVDTDGF